MPQKQFGPKQVQKNHLGLMLGVPGSELVLRVFYVSIGTLGVRTFGGRANSSALTYQKRIVPRQVWIPNRSSGLSTLHY